EIELVEIGALLAAAEQADRAGEGRRIVARVLERLPGRLEKEPMLWICQRGIARREAEELCIELVDAIEHRRGMHVTRHLGDLVRHASGAHVLGPELRD